MRQVVSRTSTYSSDEFGVCSALYEFGGMVVIHDASGCNSTYTTHDEPRWYDMDSMIFISAISEMEAIMGDDEKFISDLVETAQELKPKFVALVGAPIPYMIGTDLDAIAWEVESRTGIPAFAFPTNGMEYYTRGISMALAKLVEHYVISAEGTAPGKKNPEDGSADPKTENPEDRSSDLQTEKPVVNILGATPLDFSINTTIDSIKKWIADSGMQCGACLAMGSTLEEIRRAGEADVNLVISTGGFEAARLMEQKLGIPYVAGVPYGVEFAAYLAEKLKETAKTGKSVPAYVLSGTPENAPLTDRKESSEKNTVIIGEAVTSASLAAAVFLETGENPRVLCPLGEELLRAGDLFTPEEDDIEAAVKTADLVVADPLYQSICGDKKFCGLPHVAFSGRINESKIPDLIGVKIC